MQSIERVERIDKTKLLANIVAFISCGTPVLLQLMKTTVLAEIFIYFIFHRVLSTPGICTDVSQVGVALFPSF
jgi:hypothetical protein